MSSFKRKSTLKQPKSPPGTRASLSSPSILNISTGISSFDDILGGGLPLTTSLLVLNPDPHSAHGELIQKYFIAQGLACGQDVCVFDTHGKNLVEGCMWTPVAYASSASPERNDEDEAHVASDEKVKIAWRYEHMQKFQTTVASPSSANQDEYSHPFDLTCRIPASVLEAAQSCGQLILRDVSVKAENDPYECVLAWVDELLRPQGQSGTLHLSNVLRISIPSFASPAWGDPLPEKILRFLNGLRSALRASPRACALLTLPPHLCSDTWGGPGWIQKLGWMSDSCITLNSFTADQTLTALFPSHHGLLKIHRLPSIHTLVPPSDRFSTLRGLSSPSSGTSSGGVGENNLAFKCTRKRFLFETLHLDLEGGVGERRTAPAASSFAQDNIDPVSVKNKSGETGADMEAAVTVAFDKIVKPAAMLSADCTVGPTEGNKLPTTKAKKKVGFRSDKPDLYDF